MFCYIHCSHTKRNFLVLFTLLEMKSTVGSESLQARKKVPSGIEGCSQISHTGQNVYTFHFSASVLLFWEKKDVLAHWNFENKDKHVKHGPFLCNKFYYMSRLVSLKFNLKDMVFSNQRSFEYEKRRRRCRDVCFSQLEQIFRTHIPFDQF